MAKSKAKSRLTYTRHYGTEQMPAEKQARIERLLARLVARATFIDHQELVGAGHHHVEGLLCSGWTDDLE